MTSKLVKCLLLKKVLVQVFKHCNLLLQYKLITAIYFLYLQLQKSGKFNCSSCSKYFKTVGGLRRDQRHCSNLKHNLKKIQPSRYFKKTISDVLADKCYPDEIKIELKTFISHENQILFEEIKPIYEKFCKSSNAEMLSNSSCHFIQIL